jgi:hypothetical protein
MLQQGEQNGKKQQKLLGLPTRSTLKTTLFSPFGFCSLKMIEEDGEGKGQEGGWEERSAQVCVWQGARPTPT